MHFCITRDQYVLTLFRHTCENPDTEYIDRHLTTLFGDLKRHTAYIK